MVTPTGFLVNSMRDGHIEFITMFEAVILYTSSVSHISVNINITFDLK
jgi:hypothetical protein